MKVYCIPIRDLTLLNRQPKRVKYLSEIKMKYKIRLEKTEEGYSVSCPGLPGCWSQGETETEALENIQDAIKEYLGAIDDLVQNADMREVEVAV
jgi:predicted RNase H-like HicB family nuclease